MRSAPPIVCVVGKKKSGKTTTVVMLVQELRRRGHRVMTIKHGHDFALDRPGTDSHRHAVEGGAERVVLAGPGQFAIMGSWPAGFVEDPVRLAEVFLPDADLVVVEGFKGERLPKIEVFRRAAHDAPVWDPAADTAADYLAAVTDDPDYAARVPFPTFTLGAADVPTRLADIVEARLLRG